MSIDRAGSTPRYHGRVRTWLLAAVALAAGCQFDGGLGTGLLCPTGECPAGQVCLDGVCTTGGGGGAGDGGTADSGAPAGDARADAGEPGVNLVSNPGIEDGTDPWTPYNAELSESPEAHGGESSLVVCNTGMSGDFTVYQDVLKAPGEAIPAGERYAASVWVRSLAPETAPETVRLTIRESGGATPRIDHDGPTATGLSGQWIELQASGTVQESDRENLILIIWGLESELGFCFAADDAVMVAE